MKKNYVVIHLGGSIVVPHISDEGGMSTAFLKKFLKFMRRELRRGSKFIIVIGGGKTARAYQRSISRVTKISDWDLDWIGIHATRLNAHLLRTIFAKEAYPVIIDHDPVEEEVQMLRSSSKKLFFASGWRPGWSTDYIAVRLAEKFGAKEVIIAKDTPYVYDSDPKKNKNAKPIKKISWREYEKIIPRRWMPGLSSPVDPVATQLAEKSGITAKILRGTDLENFQKAIEGKPFTGTMIQ
ncbi:MAG: UMP kinase [Candidatus Wildermuthbacteria bacterium]|nr:UMP kinase [Candidatus Wildermuthbacteria bacterium]